MLPEINEFPVRTFPHPEARQGHLQLFDGYPGDSAEAWASLVLNSTFANEGRQAHDELNRMALEQTGFHRGTSEQPAFFLTRSTLVSFSKEDHLSAFFVSHGLIEFQGIETLDGGYLQITAHYPCLHSWGSRNCEFSRSQVELRCISQYVRMTQQYLSSETSADKNLTPVLRFVGFEGDDLYFFKCKFAEAVYQSYYPTAPALLAA